MFHDRKCEICDVEFPMKEEEINAYASIFTCDQHRRYQYISQPWLIRKQLEFPYQMPEAKCEWCNRKVSIERMLSINPTHPLVTCKDHHKYGGTNDAYGLKWRLYSDFKQKCSGQKGFFFQYRGKSIYGEKKDETIVFKYGIIFQGDRNQIIDVVDKELHGQPFIELNPRKRESPANLRGWEWINPYPTMN